MQTMASHILGAEITYSHITANKYKVYVTVYRDCNECKIAGGGGGSNTKDCGQFDLYLKTSDINGCTSKSLRQFALTRESITQMLPLCTSAVSKCQSDSGLSYGVEAHTFSTEIDFEAYKSYDNCGFEMYVQLALRADDIDNLVQSSQGETLYNYSYIDPFEKHSSPEFSSNPQVLLTVNQASRSYVVKPSTADSISVHFAKPLRGANNEIDFQTGYFLQRPISVWCNNDLSNCEANPQANPPVGVTLDDLTGYLAFTPIKNNEKATLVYEVKQWKKTSSGLKLISIVRRDILVEVTSYGQHNNPPQLFGTSIDKASNDINACIGEEICFDIQAKDDPYIFPDGSYQSANSVTYEWLSEAVGAKIREVKISQAPYYKLQFCWTPGVNDLGKDFVLDVKVSDDNCPIQASSSNQYVIHVNNKPANNIRLTDLWCGSILIESDSLKASSNTSVAWTLWDQDSTVLFASFKNIDTIQFSQPTNGELSVSITSDKGCSIQINQPINRTDADLESDFGEVVGKIAYCIGDTVKLRAQAKNNVSLNDVYWLLNNDTFSQESSIQYPSIFKENKDEFNITLSGQRGNLKCIDNITKTITVEKGQNVEFVEIPPLCEGTTSLNISESASVPNGVWKGIDHDCIKNNQIQLDKLGDISTALEICQEYTTTSISSGCLSKDTFCIWVVPNPEFNLGKTTVCGATGYFNLTNLDPQLFSFGDYNIEWTVDGKALGDNPLGNKNLIELTGLAFGDHQVIGVFKNEFGCTTTDTGTLSLLKDIDLSYVQDDQICQGDISNLNDIFGINLGGGFWTSPNNQASVINNTIDPNTCGGIDLLFTYDQFGCYVNREVDLQVVCKPEITFNLNDTICALEESFYLVATPSLGRFEGAEVIGDQLIIDLTPKTYNLIYKVEKSSCVFEYPLNMTVVPTPMYTVGSGIMSSICEDQSIELKDIDVTNGVLNITSTHANATLGGFDNVFGYSPSKVEIGQRQAILNFELIGKGYCLTKKEQYKIKINPKAKIHLTDSQFVGCSPFSFKPKFTYDGELLDWSSSQVEWDFGDGLKRHSNIQPSYTYKEPGTYSISLNTISPEGCVYDKTWLNAVTVYPSPIASFITSPSNHVSIIRPEVSFINRSLSSKDASFLWNFGTKSGDDVSNEESPTFSFSKDTGTYNVKLKVTSSEGCEDTYMQSIVVGPDIIILVPNAFSPNGKGSKITEELKVYGRSISYFHMEIFNRWGQQVYSSDNIDEEWDGKSAGKYCEIGVYAYLIQATSLSGKTYEFKGTIHLVR
jgi:gliding motility-associated-like protein